LLHHRRAAVVGAAVLIACAKGERAAERPIVVADPAVLKAYLTTWHEGPTDGRVCFDPLVYERLGATRLRPRWSDSVLQALQVDPLVSIDTSRTRPAGASRMCVPSDNLARVSISVPRVRGDSADIESEASHDSSGFSILRIRFSATLQRSGRR
jgi:hypothetical protein